MNLCWMTVVKFDLVRARLIKLGVEITGLGIGISPGVVGHRVWLRYLLSVRPTARKTYGKTASGKQITDELIDVLASKAEAGYEIEEMGDRAKRLHLLAKRLHRADGLDRDVLKCIEALTEIREDVHRIAATYGASNVRLLGSAGRGKQDASSNLGLLVDMAEGRTLFDLVALSNELEESLGVEVDVVIEASLSPYMRDRILAEAIALGGDQA